MKNQVQSNTNQNHIELNSWLPQADDLSEIDHSTEEQDNAKTDHLKDNSLMLAKHQIDTVSPSQQSSFS